MYVYRNGPLEADSDGDGGVVPDPGILGLYPR